MFACREPIKNPQVLKHLAVYNFREDLPTGTIRHFAFEVDDVDACIKLCQENGLEIFMCERPLAAGVNSKPLKKLRKQFLGLPTAKDVVLGDIKARVAFTYGPLREEVEFFEVKG